MRMRGLFGPRVTRARKKRTLTLLCKVSKKLLMWVQSQLKFSENKSDSEPAIQNFFEILHAHAHRNSIIRMGVTEIVIGLNYKPFRAKVNGVLTGCYDNLLCHEDYHNWFTSAWTFTYMHT